MHKIFRNTAFMPNVTAFFMLSSQLFVYKMWNIPFRTNFYFPLKLVIVFKSKTITEWKNMCVHHK